MDKIDLTLAQLIHSLNEERYLNSSNFNRTTTAKIGRNSTNHIIYLMQVTA